ncbi:MAG: dihydroorotate dehydrogenase electron transfer subunit [Dehalococcoidia bacterium]|nr:dihydroorotate dehydrogenase electron transfer subunit [Dehalococcoidia bacterium]
MWLEAPDIAAIAQPGQFITVCCQGLVLRRPFSVHQADTSRIALLFKIVGRGTLWLAQRQRGDKVDILGPLGNRFSIEPEVRNLLLVAGGIGIAPLVFLAQRSSAQHSVTLIYGASMAAQLYPLWLATSKKRSNLLSLPDSVRFIPVTEDGSIGKKGMVTDILPDFLGWAGQIYACGPIDMYKAMSDLICHSEGAERPKNLTQDKVRKEPKLKRCQVSLEVRMGCGIGACYGCTINTRKGPKKVCHDGPVFELDDILWEEVSI